MADRTALRLDDEASKDLAFLSSIYGTQTAAVKSALAQLAKRERLLESMRIYVEQTESESGPITEAELEAARELFR